MTVTIKYGDMHYYVEGDHADVCKAIANGDALDVYYHGSDGQKISYRITFFGDPDWVAVEL